MAYMKKPSKKMYGGSKKTMYKNGSFLEPNKELSFGGVKKMERGGTSSTGDNVNKKAKEAAANEKAKKQHKVMAMTHVTTPGLLKTLGKGAGPKDPNPKNKAVSLTRPAAKPAAKTSSSYADAKKKNPNLDKLIKERKGLTRGTVEYNRVQNQINKAYGKGPMRTEVNKVAPKPATKNPERNPTIKSSTPAKPAAKPAAKKPVAKASTKPTASRTGMSPQGDTRALQAELKSAAPAASAKKPIDRRTARSARKTDRLKKRVGKLQGKMQAGGLKAPSDDQKGLKKLPTSVRNKMGYMKKGGKR
tara:strand:+ start:773 stop:1681 length:909 start_codon:yes stop_codon:yes gene_type:complete